jgi:hypothetical protein
MNEKEIINSLNSEQLIEERDKLIALKAFYQTDLNEVKIKIAEYGEKLYMRRPSDREAWNKYNRRKVELSTSIDKCQIDIGRLNREIKIRDHDDSLRKKSHINGMTEKLFMQIAQEILPEETFNEIYLTVKTKMLDI